MLGFLKINNDRGTILATFFEVSLSSPPPLFPFMYGEPYFTLCSLVFQVTSSCNCLQAICSRTLSNKLLCCSLPGPNPNIGRTNQQGCAWYVNPPTSAKPGTQPHVCIWTLLWWGEQSTCLCISQALSNAYANVSSYGCPHYLNGGDHARCNRTNTWSNYCRLQWRFSSRDAAKTNGHL